MSSSTVKQQSAGLATTAQSGLVSTETQSFAGNKTFTGNVEVDGKLTNDVIGSSLWDYTLGKETLTWSYIGGTNDNVTPAYVLVAVAYVSTLKTLDMFLGDILWTRGGSGAFNLVGTARLIASSAYNGNSGVISYQSGVGNSCSMVLVTYNSVRYIAIKLPQTSQRLVFWKGMIAGTLQAPIFVENSASISNEVAI